MASRPFAFGGVRKIPKQPSAKSADATEKPRTTSRQQNVQRRQRARCERRPLAVKNCRWRWPNRRQATSAAPRATRRTQLDAHVRDLRHLRASAEIAESRPMREELAWVPSAAKRCQLLGNQKPDAAPGSTATEVRPYKRLVRARHREMPPRDPPRGNRPARRTTPESNTVDYS